MRPFTVAPSVTEPESFLPEKIRDYPFGGPNNRSNAFQSVVAPRGPGCLRDSGAVAPSAGVFDDPNSPARAFNGCPLLTRSICCGGSGESIAMLFVFAVPARSPTRPPSEATLWVAGWESGPEPHPH